MALEDLTGSTKYISNLNQSWPVDDDWVDEGDNHLRGIKNVLKNTFPNLDGPVTISDEALNSVVAPPQNAIINGEMLIWQRGTSFASAGASVYTADRWRYDKNGAMVHDVSLSTDVPTVAAAGRLYTGSLLIDCTTIDSSIAAGDYCRLSQVIEGYNWASLAQRIFTVSFWVKATKTGIYCCAFSNGTDRICVKEYTVSVSATWEYKSLEFPASPSAGTWGYTTGYGVVLQFMLAAGTTFHTATPDVWSAGATFATANQVNACDSALNDFRLTGVDVRSGAEAPAVAEPRLFGQELALCQRYYYKTFPYATVPATGAGVAGGVCCPTSAGSSFAMSFHFPVRMRTTPTVTTYNPVNANVNWYDSNNAADRTFNGVTASEGGLILVGLAGIVNGFNTIHLSASAEL